MKHLIFIVLLLVGAMGGRILSGDVQVDYANAGSMTQLSFSFMLSNSITANDYILLAVPFPFHSQLIPAFPATQGLSSPLGLLVTYQFMDSSNNISPSTVYYARVLTDTIDSSNYYIQFYASDRKTIIQLSANQWFYLTLKIQTSTPLTYQTSNSVLQIQISTVSSVWPNAIVYDDNLAFNYFQLAASPSQLITLSASPYNYGTAGGYLLTQKVYNMYLDVALNLPTYYYNQNLVLKFIISQQNTFFFNGACSSVAKTNAPKIALLSAAYYNCTVDATNNIMMVTLSPQALIIQQSFRFTVGITNPAIIAQGVSIIVNAVQQSCPIILGYGTASGVLNINQLYVTYQEIFLGWGLRPDALLPFDARIFRGNAATPTYMPYNSLTLKFSISQSTASFVQLKVIIKIPSESNAFVLASSFSNNLPAFPNKQVVCVTEYATSTINRQIGCTGVGALTVGTVYYIGWKMFFPYDNYQSSVSCTQFGLLTIYTTTTIGSSSYAYFLGRGDSFLNYVKSSSNYIVIGRNSSYINYMTTFPSVNLVVLSSDFQQFLSQPQSIYMNNRPADYAFKTFNDFYVITQNLAFLTYINLFTDIYCAVLIPQSTDIVNGYGSLPLVATTTPKNTLTITTSNSQDWSDYVTNTNPLVSSTAVSGSNVPGTSLLQSNSYQSLIFSFKAAYSSVTSFSSTTNTPITNNWGMMIMMNPSITFDSNATLAIQQSIPITAFNYSVSSVTNASSYNIYTMVTLRGSKSDHLQTTFPITSAKTSIGMYPFRITPFSSIFADSSCMDFMIATVDGIDGPLNKITYNGFFLINGFSQAATATASTKLGFINYNSAAPMDGSKVPTVLRLTGNITANTTVPDSLIVFFDSLTPFFSNRHSGEIYCYNSDNSKPCRYYKGDPTSPLPNGIYNYMSQSRFQIPLTNASIVFNIMIPVTHPTAQSITNFYVAYQTVNAGNSFKSLVYVEPLMVINIANSASNSGSFGLQVSTNKVGDTVSNLKLKANNGGNLNVNAGNNIGSAFSYFSEWDYFQTSNITGFSNPINNSAPDHYGNCSMLKYLFYTTNYAAYLTGSTFTYSYKFMTGIVCSCDSKGTIGSGAVNLTISTGYLPTKWGKSLPGYGAISVDTGGLSNYLANTGYQSIGNTPVATNITFPPVGPNMVSTVGSWIIPLPVGLDSSVLIRIAGTPINTNLPFTFVAPGTCAVYYNGVKVAAGCNYVASPSQVDYTLTILQSGLLPANNGFSIVHYGLSSNSSYNNINVDITCYSLLTTNSPGASQIIFTASAVVFPYNTASYIGPTSLSLGSFTQWTQNKGVVQKFNFTFTLISKGLYVTNRIRFNLGQFALDNSASAVSPSCKVYTYSTTGSINFSHDWAAIDISGGYGSLQLWPAFNLFSNNLTYTVQCSNFLSTSSPTPISITAMVVNTSADLTGQISQSTGITLPTLGIVSTNCQITLSKSFSIPSIGMQMNFNVISPGITMDSFLYLNFPSYYSNGLGPDIKCYSPNGQIYCFVLDRSITLQYIGVYAAGTSFILTITGVTMAINYNSGTFSFIFDSDNNPTGVQAAGTFADSISSTVLTIQNFPTINIFSFSQSSAYLRQDTITISLTFYLATSLSSIGLGQSLFMVFPATFYDILRFVSPSCTLNILGNTLKNYVSTCTVKGMRIKMPFLDNLVLGSTYTLTVGGIINPTNPTSNVYRYSLEITDTTGTSIIAKSYSINCNYKMPTFIVNPITIMLNYYLADGTVLTGLNSMTNIQSTPIYISPSSTINTAIYARNTYLSPLSNLLSSPSNLNLLSGSNPFPIRLSSLSSGVNYLYFSKSGDGQYYSNLPPLILTTSKNYFTAVSFIQTAFSLPVNVVNSNYTLIVTLPSSLYPMSEVDFTVTLSSSVGISVRTNPTVISFYPGKIVSSIILYINDATQWVVGTTTNLVFTPSATTTAYATGITIPLTAVAASGVPVLTFTINTATVNSISYNVKCSQHGKFVYHLNRQFAYNLSACTIDVPTTSYWLNQNSLSSLRVNQSYYACNDVIGSINVQANVSTVLLLSNLQSSTYYQINGFCQTQGGTRTAYSAITQSTLTNGGQVNTMNFIFATALTTAQKIKLVCALALNFQVDYTKVSTWDGYYCSQLLNRRRLQQSHLVSPTPRLLTAAPASVSVYFGINTYTTSDGSRAVIAAQANTSGLVTLINTKVTGLPVLQSCTANSLSYVGPNQFTGTLQINVGPNFIYIYNAALAHNGLIYIIIGDNSVWPRPPVMSQIKTGSGPNGLPPVYFRVLAYKTTTLTSGNMGWTGLTSGSGSFTLYAVASDQNPFDSANFGIIRSFPFVPETPSWESKLAILAIMLLLILC